jgi:hypothetical protein
MYKIIFNGGCGLPYDGKTGGSSVGLTVGVG